MNWKFFGEWLIKKKPLKEEMVREHWKKNKVHLCSNCFKQVYEMKRREMVLESSVCFWVFVFVAIWLVYYLVK